MASGRALPLVSSDVPMAPATAVASGTSLNNISSALRRSSVDAGKEGKERGEEHFSVFQFRTSARVYGQASDARVLHCSFHASWGWRSPFPWEKHPVTKYLVLP